MADPVALDYYFDPSCRWAWWTSIWLRRVAKERPITITWRLLSLAVQDNPDDYKTATRPDHIHHIRDFDLLRVLAAARRYAGNSALDSLYLAYGNALHGAHEDLRDSPVQRACLDQAGLPRTLFDDALADPMTESDVVNESRAALDLGALGTPTIALSGGDAALFGPIIGQVPAGEEALRLWDTVYLALQTPYVYELKRGRKSAPTSQFAD